MITESKRKSNRQWYLRNIKKLKIERAKYRIKNRKLILEKNAKWAKNNPDKVKEAQRKYHLANKRKINLYWYSRSLPKLPCSVCGSTNKVHRHHPDYRSKKVIYLCPLHHCQEHRKKRGTYFVELERNLAKAILEDMGK